MKKTLAVFLLSLGLLGSGAQSAQASPINDLTQPVSIAGQWRFKVGDDLAWAASVLDDSSWQTTAVPSDSLAGHPNYSGMFWYRHTLQLDLSQPSVQVTLGALAVTIGNVTSAYELYAGGKKIGSVGSLPPDPVPVYDRKQVFAVPESAVDDNGKLVLAMRIWRNPDVGKGEAGLNAGAILLGNVGQLREQLMRQALLPNVLLAAIYLVVGLYHLLIARRNPVLKEFFWFGLLSISLAIYTFETSQAKFFLEIPFWLHKRIEYLALYVSPILFGQTLLAVTRTSSNIAIRLFNVIFGSFAMIVLLFPGEGVMRGTLTPFQYLVAVWGLSMAAIMGWRAYRGSRSARVIVAMFLLLVAGLFNDVILDTALVASGNVLYIVFGLLMFVMALMMAERYTEILKTLESSVAKRTVELTKANRELAVAVETKGNFLANMSHEMRTPMNAILGLTHLGLKTELTDQQRDYFSKVEQSAEGLQGIIDSILDFSKLQDGQLECVTEPFNVSSSLAGVEHIWKDSIEEAGLTLNVSADAQIPESLTGDGQRLKQVLGIFVSNAIKFTEKGEVRLSAQLLNNADGAATVRFSVADTGSGIAEGQRDKLFEAFSQADNSMTREFGGTGLGLSIAQRLVELMGGQISLDSTLGVGSTFSFDLTLPVAEVVASADTDTDDLDLTPIRGARVLLVDDSELNLQVAGELLRQAKLYVDTAMDGKEAVDKVNMAAYDCVLMDVQMPVMDGYTATEQIRSKPHFRNLPVLAMTANAMPQDRARGAEAGMNDYIPKPVDPDDLYHMLLKWIESGDRDFDEEGFSGFTAPAEVSAELPDSLPGINIREGMSRVGGNSRLYLDLLADLCRDYADSGQRIEAMLDAADEDGARQLAHKLRGIANNLGVTSVGVAAEAIELPLKSAESVPAAALPQLNAALEEAVNSQATLVPLMATGGAVEMDQGEQLLLLVELMQAVTDNNPEALEMIDQLLAAAGESAGAKGLAAAKEALEMYDFASAGEHLQTVSL